MNAKKEHIENFMHANAEWVLYFVGYFWLLYNVHTSSFANTHSSQCTIWLYVSFVSFFYHILPMCDRFVYIQSVVWWVHEHFVYLRFVSILLFFFHAFAYKNSIVYINFVHISTSHNFVRNFRLDSFVLSQKLHSRFLFA